MILLKNTFPLDRKKLLLTGVSQGSQKKENKTKNKQTNKTLWSKNTFSTRQKIRLF